VPTCLANLRKYFMYSRRLDQARRMCSKDACRLDATCDARCSNVTGTPEMYPEKSVAAIDPFHRRTDQRHPMLVGGVVLAYQHYRLGWGKEHPAGPALGSHLITSMPRMRLQSIVYTTTLATTVSANCHLQSPNSAQITFHIRNPTSNIQFPISNLQPHQTFK
jgi:hypothetical protein